MEYGWECILLSSDGYGWEYESGMDGIWMKCG